MPTPTQANPSGLEQLKAAYRERNAMQDNKLTPEEFNAKAARPWVEFGDFDLGPKVVSQDQGLALGRLMIRSLNHLADRQDADAARIAKLEKQVRWQDGQIDELKKRVGELEGHRERHEGIFPNLVIEAGISGSFNHRLREVEDQLEAKAKDPGLPSNPRGLGGGAGVTNDPSERRDPFDAEKVVFDITWGSKIVGGIQEHKAVARQIVEALAQPQPAIEPCGVDWEELAESLKQWIWKEHGHANSNFKALDLVEIVKAHLAERGEVSGE